LQPGLSLNDPRRVDAQDNTTDAIWPLKVDRLLDGTADVES